MRVILCAAVIFAAIGRADEAKDRIAVNEIIEAINDPVQRPTLFTKDTDSTVNFDRLIDLHLRSRNFGVGGVGGVVSVGIDETWRVLTVPLVVSGTIRFITPEVAIVDGASVIRGAVTLVETVPLLFILKKEQTVWRICAVRAIFKGVIQPSSPVAKP
jgi:hypothetical protein